MIFIMLRNIVSDQSIECLFSPFHRIITSYGVNPRRAIPVPSSKSNPLVKRLPVTTLGVMESVDALVRAGLVTEKRPNPKLRKKNRAKMMGGGGGK